MTQKEIMKRYPVIVSTNTEYKSDLREVVKHLTKKGCQFVMVKFNLIKEGYKYVILRKLEDGEEFKPTVKCITPRRVTREFEIIKEY